ncbi:MAG: UDP-glucose 4-epimerase GalE [Alphaproteobacteria bacterium]|nr:UDP-glucose 4-epimerase GalE [Alphaproteobacteria bacterium]
MTVLVTGGAGYIGSHMTYGLVDRGEKVVVLDNLSTGVRSLISEQATFVAGDVSDQSLVRRLMREHDIDAVIHFAGSIVVPESVEQPLRYYANNTVASRALIESCVEEGVRNFVFSSTAAVYGIPDASMVTEQTPKEPINPYGRSKLMTEWMLQDAAKAHDFHYVALRYFNVAGADPKGRTGQSTPRATHLIKRACQAALGRVPALDIFGTDYPTPDGTGVRDYIHVSDLIAAHLLALDALRAGTKAEIFNCGYGRGLSVREIIKAVEKVTGHPLPVREGARRAGDPPMLVADSAKLKRTLCWTPKYDDINIIVSSAYAWEKRFNS